MAENAPPGSAGEVFRVFLKLGLTSFGGPVAHLGYFHDEFITRRKWIDEAKGVFEYPYKATVVVGWKA